MWALFQKKPNNWQRLGGDVMAKIDRMIGCEAATDFGKRCSRAMRYVTIDPDQSEFLQPGEDPAAAAAAGSDEEEEEKVKPFAKQNAEYRIRADCKTYCLDNCAVWAGDMLLRRPKAGVVEANPGEFWHMKFHSGEINFFALAGYSNWDDKSFCQIKWLPSQDIWQWRKRLGRRRTQAEVERDLKMNGTDKYQAKVIEGAGTELVPVLCKAIRRHGVKKMVLTCDMRMVTEKELTADQMNKMHVFQLAEISYDGALAWTNHGGWTTHVSLHKIQSKNDMPLGKEYVYRILLSSAQQFEVPYTYTAPKSPSIPAAASASSSQSSAAAVAASSQRATSEAAITHKSDPDDDDDDDVPVPRKNKRKRIIRVDDEEEDEIDAKQFVPRKAQRTYKDDGDDDSDDQGNLGLATILSRHRQDRRAQAEAAVKELKAEAALANKKLEEKVLALDKKRLKALVDRYKLRLTGDRITGDRVFVGLQRLPESNQKLLRGIQEIEAQEMEEEVEEEEADDNQELDMDEFYFDEGEEEEEEDSDSDSDYLINRPRGISLENMDWHSKGKKRHVEREVDEEEENDETQDDGENEMEGQADISKLTLEVVGQLNASTMRSLLSSVGCKFSSDASKDRLRALVETELEMLTIFPADVRRVFAQQNKRHDDIFNAQVQAFKQKHGNALNWDKKAKEKVRYKYWMNAGRKTPEEQRAWLEQELVRASDREDGLADFSQRDKDLAVARSNHFVMPRDEELASFETAKDRQTFVDTWDKLTSLETRRLDILSTLEDMYRRLRNTLLRRRRDARKKVEDNLASYAPARPAAASASVYRPAPAPAAAYRPQMTQEEIARLERENDRLRKLILEETKRNEDMAAAARTNPSSANAHKPASPAFVYKPVSPTAHTATARPAASPAPVYRPAAPAVVARPAASPAPVYRPAASPAVVARPVVPAATAVAMQYEHTGDTTDDDEDRPILSLLKKKI